MGSKEYRQRQRGIGPGPSSRHVANNVKALRKGLGIDLKELAERLKALGRPMSVSSINRIENEERRVDADDLFSLSVALDTTPSELLQPNPSTDTPTAVPDVFLWEEVREWLGGKLHLTTGDLFLYWERAGSESREQVDALNKQIERRAKNLAEPVRKVLLERVEEHADRVALAEERCALFDSLGLSLDQFATMKRLLDASGK